MKYMSKMFVLVILLSFNVVNFAQTYTYVLLDSRNGVLYCGISNDPGRRESEHKSAGKIPFFSMQVTGGPMTEDAARQKEVECVCTYNPPYNQRPNCPYQLGYKTKDDKYSLE